MITTSLSVNVAGVPVRKARHVRIPQLTARDIDILRWMTRHGVVTQELVGRRFFWRPEQGTYGQWAAYRRLRAMRELGLIVANTPYAHHPDVLRVTQEGARLADVGIGPASLVLSELAHTLAVVALAEYLVAAHPGSELITERELWAERYRKRYLEGNASSLGRIPDGVLRIPTTGSGALGVMTVAVELDLSRKDRRAIETMIDRYDRVPVDVVWWYVKPARFDRIRALVAELGAQDRFKVFPWPG